MNNDDVQPQNGDSAPEGEVKPLTANEQRTKELREAERIKELRERLYSRSGMSLQSTRHALPQHEIHETMEQPSMPKVMQPATAPTPQAVDRAEKVVKEDTVLYSESMAPRGRRSSLRKSLAIVGVLFFVGALAVSSYLMFMGTNEISGENISVTLSGPISVGGGEEFPFKITIANQNTSPIESATLIIKYPDGTLSATEMGKELFTERQQLKSIGTGELVNVEFKARVFGEENQEKEIQASVEYRIADSNATFYKEATPLRFKVSTSPIIMTFDSVKSISSGQDVELKLTVQSNSPTPLTDILVKAVYPDGFDFTESSPDTVSGEDTWKFSSIKPNEKQVISIKGLMTGYESETRRFTATAGVANERNKNTLASMLANANTEITIEQPFLDVGVLVNGSAENIVIIDTQNTASVEIKYTNALDATIYDGKVLVELSGNALDEFEVVVSEGFYDSTKNTITWDSAGEESLKEILPGRSSNLSFSLTPKKDIGRTPEMKIKVTVRGQRIFEDRVPQELVGTASRTIKVESIPTMQSSALFSIGPYTNSGPVPPIAEKVTQYTYTLEVKTGTNDVTGAEVIAVIPQYISWLDLVTSGDKVTYNPTTRTMKWTIGDMDSNSTEEMSVQVSFLPSLSQVGTTPTLLESQRFRATDRFTGTVVRAEHSALTTSLINDPDNDLEDGKVRAK